MGGGTNAKKLEIDGQGENFKILEIDGQCGHIGENRKLLAETVETCPLMVEATCHTSKQNHPNLKP